MRGSFEERGRRANQSVLLITTIIVVILIALSTSEVLAEQLRTYYQQSPVPTATFTPTPTVVGPTPTFTPIPPTPTFTPVPPTPTDTPVPPTPTDTPVPPTPTDTPVPPTPTDTPVPPTPTDTPVPPPTHITGGGWIDSPSGAYTPDDPNDADLTGRANFGFVSRQRVGDGAPTGNTVFQFHAGKLNFHSTGYHWLVFNQNDRSAHFMGEGTIRGDDHIYNVMIWAGDGDPDTFRIKIWRETPAGELRLYDNGSRAPIAGGSIVIHNGS